MQVARRLLFVNYTYSFFPSAHNGCLLTMLDRLLDFEPDPQRMYHLVSLNVRREDAERHAGRAQAFLGKHAERLAHTLQYRSNTTGGGWASLRELIAASWFVRRYVRQHNIDTVYAYGETAFFTLGLISRRCVRLYADLRGNFLAEEQASQAGAFRLLIDRLLLSRRLPRAGKLFVTSPRVGELARSWNRSAPMVFNANYYDDHVFRGPQTAAGQDNIFIYAGGAQNYQALPELFRLFRTYDRLYGPARLVLLINGNVAAVCQWLDQEGIPQDRVTLKTTASQAELGWYLGQATCGCLPRDDSQGSRDALPVKLAEYLACGLPVIAFRAMPVATEIIEQNRLGLVVDLPGDYEQAAQRIHAFLRQTGDIRARAAAYAREHLSWSANIARIHQEITA
jgi:glycosyltransferase involved in cell wall biosynthesis